MSFFAHHGYYAHERTRGGNYLVDVSVDTDIEEAALHDDLRQTVNYEIIYNLTAEIMEQPCRLIETVAWRIAHEIRRSFPAISPITVTVHKLSPELGGTVQSTKVEYTLV